MHERSFYCPESPTAFDLKYSGWVSYKSLQEYIVNRIELEIRA